MNRAIKFRALKDDMSNCNFVYGSLIYNDDTPRITNDSGETFHTCLKQTEGQFTGLTDRNGVEIFEGDWVKINSLYIAKVVFGLYEIGKDDWGIPHVTMGFALEYQKGDGHIGLSLMDSYEVIGNVHQHPDML